MPLILFGGIKRRGASIREEGDTIQGNTVSTNTDMFI